MFDFIYKHCPIVSAVIAEMLFSNRYRPIMILPASGFVGIMEDILYMDDIPSCYIRDFEAVVKRVDHEEGYIVLDRTAFYPLGGGQPNDTGKISWDGGNANVIDVRKKNRIFHYITGDIPEVETRVDCSIDWDKRFAHMRMHTAQHLLSAIIWNRYRAVTVGNQIHADYSHIDFRPLDIGQEDIVSIENEVNEIIGSGLSVTVQNYSKELILNSIGEERMDLSRLPSSVKELRTVLIDGGKMDLCPCAGTHVGDLSQLGRLNIIKRRSKGAKKIRIQYELK